MEKSINKYCAEFLGAFTLTLIVAFSVASDFSIITPVLAALVLGIFVYTVGSISGTHINPAVTIGLWSIDKIKSDEAIKYVVSQLVGGFIAGFVVYSIYGFAPGGEVAFTLKTFVAEMAGAILFTFGIASVVYGKNKESVSGLVVGVSLLLGITLAVLMGSAGGLNPAVAVGLHLYNLAYLIGPIVGSVIGFNLYKQLIS